MSELSSRPRASDHFYDVVGRRAFYTPCHSTVDVIFTQNTEGGEARIYQGGYTRANDLPFLNEISIWLVVNVSANIPAPEWHGRVGAPHWCRWVAPETRPVFPAFEQLYRLVSSSLLRSESVLIHCRAGAHCAGTCTAAYAMMAYRLDPWEAVRRVHSRRPCTQVIGSNFMLRTALNHELLQRAGASASAAPAAFSEAEGSASAAASAASAAPVAFSEARGSASAAASAAKAIPVKVPPATALSTTTASSGVGGAVRVKALPSAAAGSASAKWGAVP
jgi:hypothetical protein